MKTREVEQLYRDYIQPTYSRSAICFVKGKGSVLQDIEGRQYLDFFPGWAVSGLGHCHPAVINAVREQCRKLIHIPNNFLNLKQAKLAREIIRHSFPGRVFFCNSGAEATDGAVKFARRYGAQTGRYEIITMKMSFHGRTFAGIAATGQEKVREGFSPHLEGFRYAEFNDLDSVSRQITERTVGVFLEPVQGEGGISVATSGFMKGLRKLCDEQDMLLMLDEVQTCMGRTGKMFAWQNYDIEPDIMTLAKSLGNGVPIGAVVASSRLDEVITPGCHGSTFGGNPLACAAALAVIETIRDRKLLARAVENGQYLEEKLEKLKASYDVIEQVRGIALMRALKLNGPAKAYADAALARGLIINCTQETVLRIMPALTVTRKEIDRAFDILDAVFSESRVNA